MNMISNRISTAKCSNYGDGMYVGQLQLSNVAGSDA